MSSYRRAKNEGFQAKIRNLMPATAPSVIRRTIMPAIMTPTAIAGKAFLQCMPNSQLKMVAVYTPVAGKGIATNNAKAREPYLSTLGSPFRLKLSK